MGIRFFCPNGHKLNVKTHLAGKRGVCPYCGAKVLVPLESTRPSSREERGQEDAPIETETVVGAEEPSAAAPQPATPQTTPAAQGSEVVDAIAEAPDAVWYVRPPGGGQFGPAGGDVLKTWIVEGRVSADSLIWRDGWPEWKAAGQVFPGLEPARADLVAAPPAADDPEDASRVGASSSDGRTYSSLYRRASRRESRMKAIVMLVLLLLAVAVLTVALVWVLNGRRPSSESEAAVRARDYYAPEAAWLWPQNV